MRGVVLDAGALVALERNDRTVWAALKLASSRRVPVVVPSTVLAQVWPGGPRQAMLSRAVAECVLAPFDGVEKQVGELCGKTGTHDICDAHVALVAASQGEAIWTSDPRAIRRLLDALRPRRAVVVVRC